MTGAALSLWLSVSPAERAEALSDLVGAGDLRLVGTDDGDLALIRTHDRDVTFFEIGTMPVLPTAAA